MRRQERRKRGAQGRGAGFQMTSWSPRDGPRVAASRFWVEFSRHGDACQTEKHNFYRFISISPRTDVELWFGRFIRSALPKWRSFEAWALPEHLRMRRFCKSASR